MAFFDDLIRLIRNGTWIQFLSDNKCFRFVASEMYSIPTDFKSSHGSNALRIVISANRLLALNKTQPSSNQKIFSFILVNPKLIPVLINPLIDSLEKVELVQDRKSMDTDFELIMKMVKEAKLLPSFVFYESVFDPKLPTFDIKLFADKLNNKFLELEKISEVKVPITQTDNAVFNVFRPRDGGQEHIAIVIGDLLSTQAPLVRIHSECFTGDLFSSLRCDCGSQLRGAIDLMCENKCGVLVYLAQEGRGIGLVNKLRAYELQDRGIDTVDANTTLGFDSDERNYQVAAKILDFLSLKKVKLLTNNPEKVISLKNLGVDVIERVPHVFPTNPFNQAYMETKKNKSGHLV